MPAGYARFDAGEERTIEIFFFNFVSLRNWTKKIDLERNGVDILV